MKEALLIWQVIHVLCILGFIAALVAGIVTFVSRGSAFKFTNIVVIWASIGVSTFGAFINGSLFLLLSRLQSKRADAKLFFKQKVSVLLGSLFNLLFFAAETSLAASMARSTPKATKSFDKREAQSDTAQCPIGLTVDECVEWIKLCPYNVIQDCMNWIDQSVKQCPDNLAPDACVSWLDSQNTGNTKPKDQKGTTYTAPNALIVMCSIAAALALVTLAADVLKLYTRDKQRQKNEEEIGIINSVDAQLSRDSYSRI